MVWALTVAFLAALLAFDFFFHVRKAHLPEIGESAGWTAVYVSIAVAFGAFVWFTMGATAGVEFFAGYITELSLSVDNLFVFLIIMSSFRVPREDQQKVLMFGIVVSLLFRTLFILVGVGLINLFSAVFYVFGVFLLITAGNMLRPEKDGDDDLTDEANNLVIRLARKVIRTSSRYDGDRLVTIENGRRALTPMALVMVAIGGTDVMFALDSIPAIFGLTQNPYLVFTAVAFSLLGLRQLYFLVDGLLDRLVYLKYGLAIILGFIGVKLILHALHHNTLPFINGGRSVPVEDISTEVSLLVIVATLIVVVVFSLFSAKGKALTTIKAARRQAQRYLDTAFDAEHTLRQRAYRDVLASERALADMPPKSRELIHDEQGLLDLLDRAHETHDRYVAAHFELFIHGDPLAGHPLDTVAYRPDAPGGGRRHPNR